MNRTVLLLAAMCLVAGCATDVEMNPNNGHLKVLTFSGQELAAPVGQSVELTVSHGDVGIYSCTTTSGFLGVGGGTSCRFTGQPVNVEALVDVRCTNEKCTARIVDGKIEVSGVSPGQARIDVTARLDDGNVVQDFVELELAAIDSITVTTDASYRSIGPNAIFPGTELDLGVYPMAGDKAVDRMPEVTVEPEGIVTVDAPKAGSWSGAYRTWVVVTAVNAGVARLHFKSGAHEEVRTIRVAGFDEVVGGKVWKAAEGYELDIAWDPIGAPIDDMMEVDERTYANESSVLLIVGWQLRDGTLALGGAEHVTASVQGFVSAYASPDEANWVTALYSKPSKVKEGTTVTVRGMMGAAAMAHTFGIKLIPAPVGP
jgi:hypothetical protein